MAEVNRSTMRDRNYKRETWINANDYIIASLMESVVFKLVPSRDNEEEFCRICGTTGHHRSVVCKVTEGAYTGCVICGSCLGKKDVDSILKDHIKRLKDLIKKEEGNIAFLKGLIGKVETPPYDEWLNAQQRYEV